MITIISRMWSQSMHSEHSCQEIVLLPPVTLILPLSQQVLKCKLGRSLTRKCAFQVSTYIRSHYTLQCCWYLQPIVFLHAGLFYYPKQELTSFVYYSPKAISQWYIHDLEWCSSPPSDEIFDSLCAEKMYTDVTKYYNSTFSISLGYEGSSIDFVSFATIVYK